MNKKIIYLPFILLLFFSCRQNQPRFEKVLGTVCYVNLFGDGKDSYYNEIFSRLRLIDDEFNLNKNESELSKVNKNAFYREISLSEDLFTVISMAQEISALTEGAFDATIEPLVSLWNINNTPHLAREEEIADLLPLVNFKNISLNPEKRSLTFKKRGIKITLGGIAKGFAADEVIKICKKNHIKKAVIDLGGNVYVYGKKSSLSLWRVGIKNPQAKQSLPILKLNIDENSVVTSGIYERFFECEGQTYHHILSPENGFPVNNDLASVSIISKNSMLCDALSTSFFVMGKDKSLNMLPFLKKKFNVDIAAVFIDKDNSLTFSEDFPYSYEITGKN